MNNYSQHSLQLAFFLTKLKFLFIRFAHGSLRLFCLRQVMLRIIIRYAHGFIRYAHSQQAALEGVDSIEPNVNSKWLWCC